MERLTDLAGKIRNLYEQNQTEWMTLANTGLTQESEREGAVCLLPDRAVDLPGIILRLSCVHDEHLKALSPIIIRPDSLGAEDTKTNFIYFIMRSIVQELTESDIVPLAAMCEDAARYFQREKPPLGEVTALLYEKLKSLPEHKAMTTPKIQDWLVAEHKLLIDDASLRNHLYQLKPYGLQNIPRIGYYIRP